MAVPLPSADAPAPDRCLYCREKVPKRFRRVFGDEDDRAHRCDECDTMTRVKKGSAAGREIAAPDPQEDEHRNYAVNDPAALADGGQEVDR